VKLTIRESPIHEIYGGNFDLRPTSSFATAIFEHDIPAMFARHVDGLLIDHCRFDWEGSFPSFFTNGLECEDVEGLAIEGSELNGVNGHEGLALSRCPGAVVK
jgi:hypothetical protein